MLYTQNICSERSQVIACTEVPLIAALSPNSLRLSSTQGHPTLKPLHSKTHRHIGTFLNGVATSQCMHTHEFPTSPQLFPPMPQSFPLNVSIFRGTNQACVLGRTQAHKQTNKHAHTRGQASIITLRSHSYSIHSIQKLVFALRELQEPLHLSTNLIVNVGNCYVHHTSSTVV